MMMTLGFYTFSPSGEDYLIIDSEEERGKIIKVGIYFAREKGEREREEGHVVKAHMETIL